MEKTGKNPGETGEKLSPMMQQFNKAKREHPDALLFFRMGDFYELFYDDAKVASKVLGIALTSRSKSEGGVPMAGVPVKAYEQYLFKLIRAGHKVAICDQMEDPREAKGIVDRAVTRIVTAGTITEEELLESNRSNFLLALAPYRQNQGFAWIDMSTGAFFTADVALEHLADEVGRIEPAEIILPESKADPAALPITAIRAACDAPITPVSDWLFEPYQAAETLKEHFGVATLRGFGLRDESASTAAAGAALKYIGDTQMDKPVQIRSIKPFMRTEHLILDRPSRTSLELVANMRDGGRANTLLECLDSTQTPMGGRLLRQWILLPSTNISVIEARQHGVEELVNDPALRGALGAALEEVFDLERITTKVEARRANARDLVNLRQSIQALPRIVEILQGVYSEALFQCASRLDTLELTGALLERALVERPPPTLKEGGMIAAGFDTELDELRAIRTEGKGFIDRFQHQETERTQIPNLKVGFNRVFGFYIEVTNSYKDQVPEDYIRKQTLKNAERFITPELKEYEVKVLTADERVKDLEYSLFQGLLDEIAAVAATLQRVASNLAKLDVLRSLAETAALQGYVRPKVTTDETILVSEGRHPCLDRSMASGEFVPNDVEFSERVRLVILTGPNMAGKSTYLRQVALLVILAQIGSFVPAASAEIGLVDRIFTRVGASDDLARGSSTFMVEMEETANILHNATYKSLIILDEVGRGTSTFDGLSLAWAISEHIHNRTKARTLFATHYHQLTAVAEEFPRAANLSVAVREWENQIIFLRKIVLGGTDKSYGIHVARLAGIPDGVIVRAGEVLKELELRSPDLTLSQLRRKEGKEQPGQLTLFAPLPAEATPTPRPIEQPQPDTLREELRRLDPDSMPPIEALITLKRLVDDAKKS